MSKIKYTKVIKDVANAIRTVTYTEDLIPVGELADRIIAAINFRPSTDTEFIYKSITYNEDNTVTLVDQDDQEHTMKCNYDGNKLVSIEFYGTVFEMTYDEDILKVVNNTDINLENLIIEDTDHTTDYTEAYRLLSSSVPSKEVENDMLEYAGKLLGVVE
jgi:hypothetical protein